MEIQYDKWEENMMQEALLETEIGDAEQSNGVPQVDELSNDYLAQFLEPQDQAELTLSEVSLH